MRPTQQAQVPAPFYTLDSLPSQPAPIQHRALLRSTTIDQPVTILEGGINILANDDVRQNVRVSLHLGLEIAESSLVRSKNWVFPQTSNSEHVVTAASEPLPTNDAISDYLRDPSEPTRFDLITSCPIPDQRSKVLYVNTFGLRESVEIELAAKLKGYREWLEASRAGESAPCPYSDLPLGVLHVPMGEITRYFQQIEETIRSNGVNVLILNSLEFAAMTARHRQRLALELVRLCDEHHITVLIATQNDHDNMIAGQSLKGAIGILTAHAVSVFRIYGSFSRHQLGLWLQTATSATPEPVVLIMNSEQTLEAAIAERNREFEHYEPEEDDPDSREARIRRDGYGFSDPTEPLE